MKVVLFVVQLLVMDVQIDTYMTTNVVALIVCDFV